MLVPFSDLKKQHSALRSELNHIFDSLLETSSFIRGPQVSEFEKEFASLIGTKYCISCANGTDALFITLKISRCWCR